MKKDEFPLRRHHDDDYVDRILILSPEARFEAFMAPRYKQSGLSGDEWRVSAKVEVHDLRVHAPNHPVFERSYHRMKNVESFAAYFVLEKAPWMLAGGAASLSASRKGRLLFEEMRPTFADAVIGLGWHVLTANEGREGVFWHHLNYAEERAHCQQVGCSAPPTVTYRLKELQISPSYEYKVAPEYDFIGQYVWYCAEHATRGNAGLEDCDSNLERVE